MLAVNIAVIAAIFAVFHCAVYPAHLSEEQAKSQNTPYLHWVMMGLNGGGSYNPEDYEFTRSFTDTEERDAAIVEKIKSRLQEMGPSGYYSLIKTKTAKMFDPTLGISDFLDDGPVNDTALQQYVLYSGEHYSGYWTFCEGILLMLFVSMLFGAVGSLDAGENASPMRLRVLNQFAPMLAFLGLWMFLSNWESSGRYYTNFLSVILICAIVGLDSSEKYLSATAKFFKNSFCEREHLAA